MSNKLKSQNFISKIIFSLWILLILISLFLVKDDFLNVLLSKKRYMRLIELLIIMAILIEALSFKYIFRHWSIRKKLSHYLLLPLLLDLFSCH